MGNAARIEELEQDVARLKKIIKKGLNTRWLDSRYVNQDKWTNEEREMLKNIFEVDDATIERRATEDLEMMARIRKKINGDA
jgi:hypothetical protein